MQRKRIALALALVIAASTIMVAVANNGSTLTWEKTFEVTKPEVTAFIKIGENRIVGYPVKILVALRVQPPPVMNRTDYKDDFEDDDDHESDHECDDEFVPRCNVSIFRVNGTYAADLFWLNATDNQWQHLMVLQSPTNVTVTCRMLMNTYFFTPTQEGQYKVVVAFTTDTGTKNFTSVN